MTDFIALNPQAFSAYPRGERHDFHGVPLINIIRHFDIGYTQDMFITFHSYDGFATGVFMREALEENNAFIAYREDGQLFSGIGGYWEVAPFMLVMAQDPFANRFARYITEIVIE